MGGINCSRAYPIQSGIDSFKPSTQADINWNRGENKAQIIYQPSPEDQSGFSQDGKLHYKSLWSLMTIPDIFVQNL